VPLIGEVHTALLQHSVAAPEGLVRGALELRSDECVRVRRRPLDHASSPELHVGVDCLIPTASGRRLRGVGTVVNRAAITGGRVLQGSAWTELTRAGSDRRLPWSHYLSSPGRVEVTSSRADWADVAAGFLENPPGAALNLGAVCGSTMGDVQHCPELDRTPPFKAQRTTVRWLLADAPGDGTEAEFVVRSDRERTLRLAVRAEPADVLRLCEDVALHDWLLTTTLGLVERSRWKVDGYRRTEPLRLALEHLTHLWLPGAGVADRLMPIWEGLERRGGFSRQWETTVNRIRDLIAVVTLERVEAMATVKPGELPLGPGVNRPAVAG
jgi:hypothetical protein